MSDKQAGKPTAGFRLWSLVIVVLASALALPVFVIVSFLFVPAGEVWRHFADKLFGTQWHMVVQADTN